MSDFISRQAAIEAVEHITSSMSVCVNTDECHGMKRMQRQAVIELANLPSAQPEPCDDAVSREAAIDVALSAFSRGLLASPDIRKLPSVQPEPQWIPVSEKLPESKHEDLEYPTVIVCCGDGAVTLACYYESTKEWGTGEYYDRIINPVAWMPLPEPYAERRTDATD